MASLLDNVRGTVHGVLGASRHLAWYVSWHAGVTDATRDGRPAPRAAQVRVVD